jgi:ADP-ribosyl-[dinitrogen reductase] hydrolase
VRAPRAGDPCDIQCHYCNRKYDCFLPVALACLGADTARLADANRSQSHVTHNSPLADVGTLFVLRMVQAALLGSGRPALKRLADGLVAQDAPYHYGNRRMENPSGYIVETLRAVLQALFATDVFECALVDVVNRGGDSDTTGAILGMIAGAHYGSGAIPRRWLEALEPNVREECRRQAAELLRLSPLVRGGPDCPALLRDGGCDAARP